MDEKLFSARMAADKEKVEAYLASCLVDAADARYRTPVEQMRYTLTVVGLFRHVTSGEVEEAVDMVCAAAGSLSEEQGHHA